MFHSHHTCAPTPHPPHACAHACARTHTCTLPLLCYWLWGQSQAKEEMMPNAFFRENISVRDKGSQTSWQSVGWRLPRRRTKATSVCWWTDGQALAPNLLWEWASPGDFFTFYVSFSNPGQILTHVLLPCHRQNSIFIAQNRPSPSARRRGPLFSSCSLPLAQCAISKYLLKKTQLNASESTRYVSLDTFLKILISPFIMGVEDASVSLGCTK